MQTLKASHTNKGKTIEVSAQQVRRRLSQVTSYAQQALWFAQSFGLIPEYVQARKAISGSLIKVPLAPSDNTSCTASIPGPTAADHDKIAQVLYILDKFAVSDEAYHELASISEGSVPLYKVKRMQSVSTEIERLPGSYSGAYCSFPDTLKSLLMNAVSNNTVVAIKGGKKSMFRW